MTKGHARGTDQTLHLLFVQRALDKLITETPVGRHQEMALDDEDGRQADRHALISVQGAFRKVVCGKDGVQVHRRDSRQIDKVAVLGEANGGARASKTP
jgi:hypothetical protein